MILSNEYDERVSISWKSTLFKVKWLLFDLEMGPNHQTMLSFVYIFEGEKKKTLIQNYTKSKISQVSFL